MAPGRGVTIRACGRDDAELIADIGRRTFEETYAADTSAADMREHLETAFGIETIRYELATPGSTFFVAETDRQVAGFVKLNQGGAQTEPGQDGGLEIESLYVLGDFQGQRIGSRLLEKAFEEARRIGVGHVWLGVWEKNVKATRFWRRVGFLEFGSRPFRFGSVEHTDLMMRCPVKPVRCCEAG